MEKSPQVVSGLCKVPYMLRKSDFPTVVKAAEDLGEVDVLEHMLECHDCRTAILSRSALLSEEGMDQRLHAAIAKVRAR